MAEVRKHKPQVSKIGEAVRAALGETIRPVEPGTQLVRDETDPFAPEEQATDLSAINEASWGMDFSLTTSAVDVSLDSLTKTSKKSEPDEDGIDWDAKL